MQLIAVKLGNIRCIEEKYVNNNSYVLGNYYLCSQNK